MEYLVYVSTANNMMTDEELLELLTQAREKNATYGITGMLLYGAGTFMQVIEGEKDHLAKIFAAIKQDPRHRNVIELINGKIAERIFPYWAMAFASVDAETLETIDGYLNPANKNFIGGRNHASVTMLKTFVETNKISVSF
ncbi:FAD-dependent sensor of blue light [Mucilaginibacter oryzae]|uniref:FAD-dependent sensor of blue light n=1 Tax=Mucilaginibacter oryzae TaxID=468058 RepID=A0A316HK55_9SPHI|nr:BLUF domain-containing protein [Mucilaginibacter oryzae]PWK80533.1 FAD-dependent sensor of blue light [Mucilaginibacter oryzae]